MAKRTDSTNRGAGFTLVELLVVMGIILLLAGITMPVIGNALRNARRTQCVSNLRQVGIAITMYAEHNPQNPRMYYPYSKTWVEDVAAFVKVSDKESVFTCPGSLHPTTHPTYAVHPKVMPPWGTRMTLADVKRPSEVVMAADAGQGSGPDYASYPYLIGVYEKNSGLNSTGASLTTALNPGPDTDTPMGSRHIRFRHRISGTPAANFVFFDQHAEALKINELFYKHFIYDR